jgi:hypothetical protein
MTKPLKPYSIKELSQCYDVSYKVMRSWLSPIKKKVGKQVGKCFNVKQIRIIFDHLGHPEQ